jgi:hypothetical protein
MDDKQIMELFKALFGPVPAVDPEKVNVLDGKRVPVPHKKASEAFPLRGFIRCCECDKPLTAGFARGRGGKQYARYWCFTKGCNAVGISRNGLESHFINLLAMMQPTAELIAKLPDIAAST